MKRKLSVNYETVTNDPKVIAKNKIKWEFEID